MIIEFWTQNLNPITCYQAPREVKKKERVDNNESSLNEKINKGTKKKPWNTRAVIVEDKYGKKIEFDTVILAAKFINVGTQKLYAILNNRLKNNTQYKIYKSQIV